MLKIDRAQTFSTDKDTRTCRNVRVGQGTVIWQHVNLYDCQLGGECMVGAFVEIQAGAVIGDRTRIQSHSFICDKVRIGDDCFIAHGVMFINDKFQDGGPGGDPAKWQATEVENGVSIGSNATILPVRIGAGSVIGAGAVVTKEIPPGVTVAGNPARILRSLDDELKGRSAYK